MDIMDIIVALIITLILALAIIYIVKAKKSGVKCIGCVHGKTCSGSCSSCQSKSVSDDKYNDILNFQSQDDSSSF